MPSHGNLANSRLRWAFLAAFAVAGSSPLPAETAQPRELACTRGLQLIRAIQAEEGTVCLAAVGASLEDAKKEEGFAYPEDAVVPTAEQVSVRVTLKKTGRYHPGFVMFGRAEAARLLGSGQPVGEIRSPGDKRRLSLYFCPQAVSVVEGGDLELRISRPGAECRVECLLLMAHPPDPSGLETRILWPRAERVAAGGKRSLRFTWVTTGEVACLLRYGPAGELHEVREAGPSFNHLLTVPEPSAFPGSIWQLVAQCPGGKSVSTAEEALTIDLAPARPQEDPRIDAKDISGFDRDRELAEKLALARDMGAFQDDQIEKAAQEVVVQDLADLSDLARDISAFSAAYQQQGNPLFLNAARLLTEQVFERRGREGGWPHRLSHADCRHAPPHRGNSLREVAGLLVAMADYAQASADDRAELMVQVAAKTLSSSFLLPEGGLRTSSCPETTRADANDAIEALLTAYVFTKDVRLGGEACGSIGQTNALTSASCMNRLLSFMRSAAHLGGTEAVTFHIQPQENQATGLLLNGNEGSEVSVWCDGEQTARLSPNRGETVPIQVKAGVRSVRVEAVKARRCQVWAGLERVVIDARKGILTAGAGSSSFCFQTPRTGGTVTWKVRGFAKGRHRFSLFDAAGKEVLQSEWEEKGDGREVRPAALASPEEGGQMWWFKLDAPGEVGLSMEGAPPFLSLFPQQWFLPEADAK